ncbi:glycosyltransferase [Roseomonas sp. AR75]|uniref:glycosyltransferase family protein n=1 Tax=Roseomonas sp. AR75 TaxID=2562311 RepID=UPI0010C06342|nr:glycosyltransferase [Roseomonas sp. AR75]
MPTPDPATAPADPALCARIPLGLARIVQIGGDAALAAFLARRDPGCALTRLARLAPGAIPAGAAEADLVVLQALAGDAADAIRNAAALLARDGVLLVDLPNAEHWRIAQQLLVGGIRPTSPPPDAMTRDGLLAAIRGAGLIPLDVPQSVPEAEAAEGFARQIAPALAALGVDAATYLRRAAPPRWLLRAARQAPPPLMLLAHVLKPVGGVNEVRVDMPLGAVATHPGIALRIGERPETPKLAPDVPRILILHRRLLNNPEAPAFINHFRQRGWVVVQEFDDDPAHWPVIAQSDHFAFRGVHAVQTTTPKLEALFRAFNDEVMVFPNTVAELPEVENFADASRLTLFLGALRREEDTAPYIDALNAVLAEAGDRLGVEVIFDRASFDALRTPHKRFHPILPYSAYRALMARCEIAFLPLADTRFNSFKSDLKFVEAGAHRLCCLASPVVYGATIRDGETGFIVDDAEALGDRLRALLAAPERARAVGDAARGWVRENRLVARQVPARLAWYRGLWERRAALDAALVKRAPEVGA